MERQDRDEGERVAAGTRWRACLFIPFCAVIVLAPLPLAANRPWSWNLLAVLVGLLLLAAAPVVTGPEMRVFRRASFVVASLLFLLTVGVIVLQAWCDVPESWAHAVWALLPGDLASVGCATISVNPFTTLSGLARLLAYGGAFLLAVWLCSDPLRAAQLLRAFVLAGAVYAAYGLVLYALGSETILWYEKWAYRDSLTSTFVNRNSFAAYGGMVAVAALGIILDGVMAAARDAREGRGLPVMARSLVEHHLYLAALVLCLAAVVLTGSRAGGIATALGLLVVGLALAAHHRAGWRSVTLISAGVVGLVVAPVVAGGSFLMSRLDAIPAAVDADPRGEVIAHTATAVLDRPWLGVGYGTFADAWTVIRPSGVNTWFRQTHSTYIENAFELGIPAALCLALAVVVVLAVCIWGVRVRRRHGLYPAIALAAPTVPIVHSTIDFSLQMPAVSVTVAALLGLGYAQSIRSHASQGRDAEWTYRDERSKSGVPTTGSVIPERSSALLDRREPVPN